MIDSNETRQLKTALIRFRDYISENYYPKSQTSVEFMKVINRFEQYAAETQLPFDTTLQCFYRLTTGANAFERPKQSKKLYARAVRMIADFYKGGEPQKRYLYNSINCPTAFQGILESYRLLMAEDLKSEGTIRTRIGRIKVFFIYLDRHACCSLAALTGRMLVDFIVSLADRYGSQARASILYTIRNFFSYEVFMRQISFDPMAYLTGIHSKKHERLSSFYTPGEVRRVLNAVDRDTPWGKTIYLMMLLACIYGMRTSDIKRLSLSDIRWSERIISLMQHKTRRLVSYPLTDEIKFALLDYIKNVRPATEHDQVFIRMRPPHIPYSIHDHFAGKLSVYFEKAGVDTSGKHHGLHSLRHSLASNLLNGNVPVNEIAVILGHTSVSSTKTYIWSDMEHLRNAAMEVPCHD